MAVVSALVRTSLGEAGNSQTEGFFIWEFSAASYQPGGEQADLSAYFRRVEVINSEMASGALKYTPSVNEADLPNQGGASGRIQIYWGAGSGLTMAEVASGTAVSGARAQLHVIGY